MRSVRAVIERQFPELSPARVRTLGEGCDSVAFEVNGEWVFRFPKNDETAAQYAVEARLLPLIAPRLPLAVPLFEFQGIPSPECPRTFCGYRKLAGEPAIRLPAGDRPSESLAGPIARFLSALHSVPIQDASDAGVPRQSLAATVDELRTEALSDLERVRDVDVAAPIDSWLGFLEAAPAPAAEAPAAVLLHNDLAAEHLLVDPATGRITGVIDWSDVAIGDPVFDFSGLFHWGGETFVRGIVARYEGPLGQQRLELARYLGACRGAMDVAFGLEYARPEYIAAGLRALHLCVRP